MNEESFVARRETDWERLKVLCQSIEGKSLRSLRGESLKEFVDLYRRASRDLAVVRTSSRNLALVQNLNDLVGRAYGILYTAPRSSFRAAIKAAVVTAARTVRARKSYVGVSAGLFFGSALFAFAAIGLFPQTRQVLIPSGFEDLLKEWQKGHFQEHPAGVSEAMAGFYASNNPRVAVIAGAVGAGTMGIGSIYLVIQNGLMLGTLAHEMNLVGKLGFLVASIAPHGVSELSGAIIAGAAGLLLGWAVVNPGRRLRGDALRAVGKDAFVLITVSVCLMLIAAPFEAFFSFDPFIPTPVKAVVALLVGTGWALFWTMVGKEENRQA